MKELNLSINLPFREYSELDLKDFENFKHLEKLMLEFIPRHRGWQNSCVIVNFETLGQLKYLKTS